MKKYKITFKKDEACFSPGYYWDTYDLPLLGRDEDEDDRYREVNMKVGEFLLARFPSYIAHNNGRPLNHSFSFKDQADDAAFQLYIDNYFDL
jgi:hypothetical protein